MMILHYTHMINDGIVVVVVSAATNTHVHHCQKLLLFNFPTPARL
jgi:hypothetical protein